MIRENKITTFNCNELCSMIRSLKDITTFKLNLAYIHFYCSITPLYFISFIILDTLLVRAATLPASLKLLPIIKT